MQTNQSKPNLEKQKILIIDDEEDLRDIVENYVSSLGCKTFKASDGKDALNVMNQESIDVIISDINMPNMTGMQFLAKIREMGLATPVIFITAYGDQKLVYEAWKNGAYDFIDKPINQEYLVEVVSAALLFGNEYLKHSDKSDYTEMKFIIRSTLAESFRKICKTQGVREETMINSLISKFIEQEKTS